MLFITPILLMIAEGFWQILIKYPPSIQQLSIGTRNVFMLWVVKILSLILIVFATYFFSVSLESKVKKYYWIIVFVVPSISLIWMSYPLDALKLFIISGVFYFVSKKKIKTILGISLGLITILLLNIAVFKEKPEILKIFSLNQPRDEVNFHYQVENNLNPDIPVPNLLKKLVYNKIFFAFRDGLNSSLYFFDAETLFFQEIHPLGQKSFVMFFWPEIFIFILGIWFYTTKQITLMSEDLILTSFSFVYFLSSGASPERRLILVIFIAAIILSKSIWLVFYKNSKTLRIIIASLLFLTAYGWATNFFDRSVRPTYWLDNRPIAYDFILSNMKKNNRIYDQILVPNTLFALKNYCPYYLNVCPTFKYEDFNLAKQEVSKNTLYIGFIGNFIGRNSQNSFSTDFENEISNKGLEILSKTEIPNNIANGYGQILLITQSK